MLPRSNRLPGVAFLEVKRKGLLVNGKYLSAVVLRSKDETITRFGIVVSTKISKKAVDRNKVRRLIRLFILKNLTSISKGHDVAILTKSSILNKVESEVHSDLTRVFDKAKLFD